MYCFRSLEVFVCVPLQPPAFQFGQISESTATTINDLCWCPVLPCRDCECIVFYNCRPFDSCLSDHVSDRRLCHIVHFRHAVVIFKKVPDVLHRCSDKVIEVELFAFQTAYCENSFPCLRKSKFSRIQYFIIVCISHLFKFFLIPDEVRDHMLAFYILHVFPDDILWLPLPHLFNNVNCFPHQR